MKRYDIGLGVGHGGFQFGESADGDWVLWADAQKLNAELQAELQSLRASRIPPAGHIIDETGKVRRVDGVLPILADGVVAQYGNSYYYWDIISQYGQPIKYGWTERILESCEPHDAEYSWTTDPSKCYSTRESALATRKEQKNDSGNHSVSWD